MRHHGTGRESAMKLKTETLFPHRFFNFGQFKDKSIVKYSKVKDEYVIYPNWEILRIIRLRNNESLYKGRIIKFVKL